MVFGKQIPSGSHFFFLQNTFLSRIILTLAGVKDTGQTLPDIYHQIYNPITLFISFTYFTIFIQILSTQYDGIPFVKVTTVLVFREVDSSSSIDAVQIILEGHKKLMKSPS